MSNTFKIGDTVRIVRVDANDEILGISVGKDGIYMGQDTDYPEYACVKFMDRNYPYIVDVACLEKTCERTLDSILVGFDIDATPLFVQTLNEFIEEKQIRQNKVQ